MPSSADAPVLADAAAIVPGTWIAIEAAMDAGSSTRQEIHMTTIGKFTRSGNEFTGEIATLTIRAKDVRISPANKTSEAGPSHRVYAGRAEIGAAWSKKSKEGNAYLSVLLDDPSMMAPFYASLVSGDEGGDHSLIWSRGARNKAD